MEYSVCIIQPPQVQLNGPYPSGAYLSSFFRALADGDIAGFLPGITTVRWIDLSNQFFSHLFSATTLAVLFERYTSVTEERAREAEATGDTETAWQLRRYLSLSASWIQWIEPLVSILRGGDRELCHALVRSPHAPRGARMDRFLSSLDRDIGPDDARMLATLALEDLADWMTVAVDSEFSLVRYAESMAASERSFARVESALDRPVIRDMYLPFLDALWEREPVFASDGTLVLCISVPFPGCLAHALATARSARKRFGNRVRIFMGGGYVNTELRNCINEGLFTYIDHLVFDRGYGAMLAWFHSAGSEGTVSNRHLHCPSDLQPLEQELTCRIFPDYRDIDFSRYPRLADNPNPMHRLWNDGVWIKAFLAHGCYWHRCSFCDVSLDYIRSFVPLAAQQLYRSLRKTAIQSGVRGIHLVDEAAPPRALRDFALENLRAAAAPDIAGDTGGLLSFWGNIRFEKTFSRDLADFLAAGGLLAVSGGIEIASPEGFKAVDKGIDLENLVAVCAAFKEAGVLVHAYLIYGYWNEDPLGVIDAAEVMRQLFAAGLVDSAFWHKFVLTRHSRVYQEWLSGLHRDSLEPLDESGDFADNDLRFRGENASRRYTGPLDNALHAWMQGEGLETPVRSWFPFAMPSPSIESDLVERLIERYEDIRDRQRSAPFDPSALYWWTASIPVPGKLGGELCWWHAGEEVSVRMDRQEAARVLEAVHALRKGETVNAEILSRLSRKTFEVLRAHGLVRLSPL